MTQPGAEHHGARVHPHVEDPQDAARPLLESAQRDVHGDAGSQEERLDEASDGSEVEDGLAGLPETLDRDRRVEDAVPGGAAEDASDVFRRDAQAEETGQDRPSRDAVEGPDAPEVELLERSDEGGHLQASSGEEDAAVTVETHRCLLVSVDSFLRTRRGGLAPP